MTRVQPGMSLRTASGGVASVRCVVVSSCERGIATLTELPCGLQLTEWHPVLWKAGGGSARWHFPNVLGRRVVRRAAAVYNLVLSREHIAMVSGVPCATLGHGLAGPIVGHPFWGTQAVLEVLEAHPGWRDGYVLLASPLQATHAF